MGGNNSCTAINSNNNSVPMDSHSWQLPDCLKFPLAGQTLDQGCQLGGGAQEGQVLDRQGTSEWYQTIEAYPPNLTSVVWRAFVSIGDLQAIPGGW